VCKIRKLVDITAVTLQDIGRLPVAESGRKPEGEQIVLLMTKLAGNTRGGGGYYMQIDGIE